MPAEDGNDAPVPLLNLTLSCMNLFLDRRTHELPAKGRERTRLAFFEGRIMVSGTLPHGTMTSRWANSVPGQ